ncbi:SH3 domain-containing protein [Thalassobacillus hwangdonensis]|uniref:SH3 domain-containing protein n=1 Tax=Thalassobacillus hwangdonensis TaxID=546108 RepID=A0ABW3L1B5_9BACI
MRKIVRIIGRKSMLKITDNYRTNYPNPITLTKGQSVIVGEKYEGEEDWDHWIFCYTVDESSGGWVQEQLIERSGGTGTILEDYTAKELNVDAGDRVLQLKELNGWYWVRHAANSEEGWIPKEVTKLHT